MNTNQAFEILKSAGGIQAARIILKKFEKPSKFKVWRMAHKLRRGVPVAKIIGEKWFYGLPFYTNRHTLDPRPDTETLVDAVIKENEKRKAESGNISILDLGTGTGCLVISLVKNIPNASGVGIDQSCSAVRVAKKNVHDLGVDNRVQILRGDFGKPNTANIEPRMFDVIVSNPPYISRDDLRVNRGAMHDPKISLYAKNNGLGAYEAIAKNARHWIKPGGKIYLEIGIDQGIAVRDIFVQSGWDYEGSWNDLSGIERVLCFTIS